MLESAPDIVIVDEAVVRLPVRDRVQAEFPQVVLMELRIGRPSEIDEIRSIRQRLPQASILMCTRSESNDRLLMCIKAGALGVIEADAVPARMLEAIREAAQGVSVLPSCLATYLVLHLQTRERRERRHAIADLTRREDQILRLIAQGARDREVAHQLFISESTVKKHVQNVLRKLQARNRAEAVSYLHSREAGRLER